MRKSIWYAVSKTGQGRVFTSKPEREESFGIWVGESVGCVSMLVMLMESDGFAMPAIKWSDEPVELTITLGYGE